MNFENVKIIASANCIGGSQPDPPIVDYPLLAWTPEKGVHTEDGKISIHDLKRFGSTSNHIKQIVDYAVKAGLLDG